MGTHEPERLHFDDDGTFPNSEYPVLIYRNCFNSRGEEAAAFLIDRFAKNGWSRAWKNGIYPFHHYHSTAHEVLGIYDGKGTLILGGENGQQVGVECGDVIVLPAGTSHMCWIDENLKVVGAYADGREWDINRGEPGERPRADENISKLPLPERDPMRGNEGLPHLWRKE